MDLFVVVFVVVVLARWSLLMKATGRLGVQSSSGLDF